MPVKSMQDKVVVVTGSGRGIGREIALLMAEHGAKVVVNDTGVSVSGDTESASPADEVVAEIRALGGEAVASRDSVAEWSSAKKIVQAAIDTFGRIDCVVNNAGILRDKIFHQMPPEDFDLVVRVHLNGSFYVSRAAAEHFRAQKSGAFVHMTSTSGIVGNFGQCNYSAAKMGILGLSKSIALDMQRFNVRSNCISPFAFSRMVGSIPDTPDQKERVDKIKTMTPDKIAPFAVFLGSDAAREVNGQILAVRRNEVFLIGHPRPIRSIHRSDGWTPETIENHLVPALRNSFAPLDRSPEVFSWDPI
ncbi:MAG: 3-hydroxyacyl-CoA dehydrogenase [Ramlibacter sp.]|nr:3-hydroxyacyl-CoA dehydrogenase [Ramlibacter sp.]